MVGVPALKLGFVPEPSPHKVYRGDVTLKPAKYSKTLNIGNTTIHIVSPPPMTQEEKDKILKEMHNVAWQIIRELEEKKDS